MAKTKDDQLELGGKTGICPICGGVTVTKVLHYGGFTPAQLIAHAVPDSMLPERAANPVTAEETAALARFQAAHAARGKAVDAVIRLDLEGRQPELLGGRSGFEPLPQDPAKKRALREQLEEAKGAADAALEAEVLAERAWKELQDARQARTEAWRREQMAATHEKLTAGKVGLAARLRALIAS